MPETDLVLRAIYEGWGTYQGYLVKAITPLSADQLMLRAAPNLRTIHAIATHLIAVRVRWFHQVAGAGSAEIAPIGAWDREGAPTRTAAELVSGLEASWELIKEALAHWTPEDLARPVEATRHGETHTFMRPWIIWHVIEHDVHHGGELSFSLGMHGLTGLDV